MRDLVRDDRRMGRFANLGTAPFSRLVFCCLPNGFNSHPGGRRIQATDAQEPSRSYVGEQAVLRVTWWMMLGMAASAAFEALCVHLRLPASAELVYECGWYSALFAFMAYLACREFGTSWQDLVPLRRVSARLIAPVLAITLGVFVASIPLVAICRRVLPHLPVDDLDLSRTLSLPIQYVCISLLPAIFEEAVCRGIVLQALLAADMSERRAILFSAFLFAAIHFSLVGLPSRFVFGVLVAWMFVRTGSLLPGMLMHAVNNAIVVALCQTDRLPAPISDWLGPDGNSMPLAVIVCAGLALGVMGVVAFRRVLAAQVRVTEVDEATSYVLDRAA